MKVDCIESYDLYKNESLPITLKIEKNGNTQDWLVMKKSSIVVVDLVYLLCESLSRANLSLLIWVNLWIILTCMVILLVYHLNVLIEGLMRNIGWVIGSIMEVERRKMWRYEEICLCELPRRSKLEKSCSVITTEMFNVLDLIF
jgi:hypothetical protein